MKKTSLLIFIIFLVFNTSLVFSENNEIQIEGVIEQVIDSKKRELRYKAKWQPKIELAGGWLSGPAVMEIQNPFENEEDAPKINLFFPEITFGTVGKFYNFNSEEYTSFNKLNLKKKENFNQDFLTDLSIEGFIQCLDSEDYLNYAEQFSLLTYEDDICIDFNLLPGLSFFPKGLFGYQGVISEFPQNGNRWNSKFVFYSFSQNNTEKQINNNELLPLKPSVGNLRYEFEFNSSSIINLSQNIDLSHYSCGAGCSFISYRKYFYDEGFIRIATYTYHNEKIEYIKKLDSLQENKKPIFNNYDAELTFDNEKLKKFYNWSDEIICDKAWYDGQWTDDNDLWEFVEEAKIRNLDCKKLGF